DAFPPRSAANETSRQIRPHVLHTIRQETRRLDSAVPSASTSQLSMVSAIPRFFASPRAPFVFDQVRPQSSEQSPQDPPAGRCFRALQAAALLSCRLVALSESL